MLELNWSRKKKLEKERKLKKEETKRQKQIEKKMKDPQYVQEEIDGELVIHNMKLEVWIPVEQPIL